MDARYSPAFAESTDAAEPVLSPPSAVAVASTSPRISVLMPVYNAAAWLDEAMGDLVAQTFTDFEIIAVDDGSRDDSLAVLHRWADRERRLHILSRPNTGIVGALNDALAVARGEFCARMDADDRCDPSRFALQISYLEKHPACVALGTGVQCLDPTGAPMSLQNLTQGHDLIDGKLLAGDAGAIVHATTMIRTTALRQVRGWNPRFNWVEDLDIFLRLAEVGQLENLPEPLYRYRRHAQSVCMTHYQRMCQDLRTVVKEAHERRGLPAPLPQTIRPDLGQPLTPAAMYRSFACHAMNRNNLALARRHALAALRRQPLSVESWRVLYWSLAA